eukprot:gene30526-25983_t
MASAEDAALLKEIAKLEKDILRSRKELGDPAIQAAIAHFSSGGLPGSTEEEAIDSEGGLEKCFGVVEEGGKEDGEQKECILITTQITMLSAAARISEHEAMQWLKSSNWDYHAATAAQAARLREVKAAAAGGGNVANRAAGPNSALRAMLGMRSESADIREVAGQLEAGNRAPMRMSSYEAAAEIDAEVRPVLELAGA